MHSWVSWWLIFCVNSKTGESDKASMEIPAETSGVVKEVFVAVGDNVVKGTLLLKIDYLFFA